MDSIPTFCVYIAVILVGIYVILECFILILQLIISWQQALRICVSYYKTAYYYILIYAIKILKFFGYEPSTKGIPAGCYCYTIKSVKPDGGVLIDTCPHYKYMPGQNAACTYVAFVGCDACFSDQCKLCSVNSED